MIANGNDLLANLSPREKKLMDIARELFAPRRKPIEIALERHQKKLEEERLLALANFAKQSAAVAEERLAQNNIAFAAQDAVSKPRILVMRKKSEQTIAATARMHREGIERVAAITRGERVAKPRKGSLR